MTFDEWQAKHGPNGGAYDIEQQRAGWEGALAHAGLSAAPTPPQPAAQPGEEALEKALCYEVDEIRRIANAVRAQNGPTDPATPQQYVYAGWAACAAAARAALPATQKEMP